MLYQLSYCRIRMPLAYERYNLIVCLTRYKGSASNYANKANGVNF